MSSGTTATFFCINRYSIQTKFLFPVCSQTWQHQRASLSFLFNCSIWFITHLLGNNVLRCLIIVWVFCVYRLRSQFPGWWNIFVVIFFQFFFIFEFLTFQRPTSLLRRCSSTIVTPPSLHHLTLTFCPLSIKLFLQVECFLKRRRFFSGVHNFALIFSPHNSIVFSAFLPIYGEELSCLYMVNFTQFANKLTGFSLPTSWSWQCKFTFFKPLGFGIWVCEEQVFPKKKDICWHHMQDSA